jgi:hypothetical protein
LGAVLLRGIAGIVWVEATSVGQVGCVRRMDKLYVIKKYIKASSAPAALRKDKRHPVDEITVDEQWKSQGDNLARSIGFHNENRRSQAKDKNKVEAA